MVKQISVFLENTKGRLAEMTNVLKDADIDLFALNIADTTNFGILRAIVSDEEKAVEKLHEAGYTVHINEVIAAEISDTIGSLSDILTALGEGDVSVEYLYSFVRAPGDHALMLFKVDDVDNAKVIFAENNIRLINKTELVED